jgi:chromosome partitioning protein
MKADILAIANRKGGEGKTTSVSSIAGVASSRGQKTLLIDMDSQANLTANFLKEEAEQTICDMFEDRKRRLPIVKVNDYLYIVPGDGDIAGLESVLKTPEERLILSEALEKVRADFDLILIDCPPDMGWCTINALSACDFLFVPMKMSGKSFQGVGKIANLCYQAAKHTYINGIFFTEYYANRKSTKKYEAKARNTYGGTVMQTVIRPCSKLGECADEFKDIIAFDPKCNGAQDYTALWDEMCRIMEMCKKGIM